MCVLLADIHIYIYIYICYIYSYSIHIPVISPCHIPFFRPRKTRLVSQRGAPPLTLLVGRDLQVRSGHATGTNQWRYLPDGLINGDLMVISW